MTRIVRAAVLACSCVLAAAGDLVVAQALFPLPGPPAAVAAPPPAAKTEVSKEPQPYPLPLLAQALGDTSGALQAIEANLQSEVSSRELAAGLDECELTLTRLDGLQRSADLRSRPLRVLRDLHNSWGRLQRKLDVLERSLEQQTARLDDDRAKLRELDERWTATRAVLLEQGAPKAVIDRVEAILAKGQALGQPASDRFGSLLLLQDRAATQRMRVGEALSTVGLAMSNASQRALVWRGQPFWSLFGGGTTGPGFFEEIQQSLLDKVGAIVDFVGESERSVAALAALLAVLVSLAYWVRSRSAAFPAGSPARALAAHPVISGVVVALVTWYYAQQFAPRPVTELVVLLLAVPMGRVLSLWVAPSAHELLNWIVVVTFVDRLRGLVAIDSLTGRIVMLLVSVSGAVVVFRTLRARRKANDSRWPGRAARISFVVTVGCFASMTASSVVNAMGHVGLADVLLRAALSTLFMASIMLASALVIETWLGLLTPAGLPITTRSGLATETERLRHTLVTLTRLAALSGWVMGLLTVLGIDTRVIATISSLVAKRWSIGSLSISLGNLLAFGISLAVGLTAARLLRLLLDQAVLPKFELPRGVPAAISTTVQYVAVTFCVVTAIFALGIESSRFTILASAIGIGVGFGLQNIVNNFVSGLILLYERPIQTGDTIEMGTLMGTVDRIGVRSSTVRTFDGAEVIVPNATLISNDVTNWTLSDRTRRIDVPVGVAYGTDPRRVIALLEDVARSQPSVITSPAPVALFKGFGDSSLDFVLRVWTSNFDDWVRLRSDLHVGIYEALAREGIEIPFPQRDLHLRTSDPGAVARLTRETTT